MMVDEEGLYAMRAEVRRRVAADARLLEELRTEARALAGEARPIRPRTTTAVALVASDGGNNGLQFDPFFLQLIQVVDSYGKVLFRGVVSPTTDSDELSRTHVDPDTGAPRTALGRLIVDLQVQPPVLSNLSPMIPPGHVMRDHPDQVSPSWIQVYRDLWEWALIYERICYNTFATDTLVIRDGLLRSKIFRGDLFRRTMARIESAIQEAWKRNRRRIYLVGVAKHSSVLDRYKLALDLENVLPPGSPVYVSIPPEMERRSYRWQEWAMGDGAGGGGLADSYRMAFGQMFFARFGPHRNHPVWPVDLLPSQADRADEIFGFLLADARDGFPVPYYPRCLQQAHEFARVVDFDLRILQDEIFEAIRLLMPEQRRPLLDAFRLRTGTDGGWQ